MEKNTPDAQPFLRRSRRNASNDHKIRIVTANRKWKLCYSNQIHYEISRRRPYN